MLETNVILEDTKIDGCACDAAPSRRRARSDRGEGVISAAIAVLIVAFLGAAMWLAFNRIWTGASTNIENQVNLITTSHGS